MHKKSHQTGFTLAELLITVGVSAILLAAAVPSMKEMYNNNVSLSYSNDLRVALYRAQNEAVRRNRSVTLKAKGTNNDFWQGGWDIYLDTNNNNLIDPVSGGTPAEEVISSYVPSTANQTLKNTTFGGAISFDAFGVPESRGDFWICRPDDTVGTLSRTVTVEFSGFISVAKGATCS